MNIPVSLFPPDKVTTKINAAAISAISDIRAVAASKGEFVVIHRVGSKGCKTGGYCSEAMRATAAYILLTTISPDSAIKVLEEIIDKGEKELGI